MEVNCGDVFMIEMKRQKQPFLVRSNSNPDIIIVSTITQSNVEDNSIPILLDGTQYYIHEEHKIRVGVDCFTEENKLCVASEEMMRSVMKIAFRKYHTNEKETHFLLDKGDFYEERYKS